MKVSPLIQNSVPSMCNSATYFNTQTAVFKFYLPHEFMNVSLKLCNAIEKKALLKVSHGHSFQHCSIVLLN